MPVIPRGTTDLRKFLARVEMTSIPNLATLRLAGVNSEEVLTKWLCNLL